MKIIRIIIFIFLVASIKSYSQYPLMTSEADSLIKLGAKNVYNVQFDKAEKLINKAIKKRALQFFGTDSIHLPE